MAYDFASNKAKARRVVHNTLAVQAFYQDSSMSVPAEIRARWLNKTNVFTGDVDNQGYAEMLEAVDRIVLFPDDTPTVNFKKGGSVSFPGYDITFVLELREPSNGPLQEVWKVTRG